MSQAALVIDLIFVGIFLAIIIADVVRGFVKSFMHLGSNIVSLILAYLFHGKLGDYLSEKFISGWVSEKLAAFVTSHMPSLEGIPEGYTVTVNDLLSQLSGKLGTVLSLAGINIADLSGEYGSLAATDENIMLMVEQVSKGLSGTLSTVIAFAAIFLISLLLFAIVTAILNAICKLPVISTANRILGLVFGVLCALVIGSVGSVLVCKIIEVVAVFSDNTETLNVIQQSYVLRFFSEHNPLGFLLEAINK